MITVAITGGIACGKSSFTEMMLNKAPAEQVFRFDSDQCVAELFDEDSVQRQIAGLDSSMDLVGESGVNRSLLRERAFENSDFRENLESVLHPLVLERVCAFVKSHSGSAKLLLIEVPLLYEVEFPLKRDMDLVVASSRATQLSRLSRKRGINNELAERIIDSQMMLEEKMKRADLVIWNDGTEDALREQASHLVQRCHPLFTFV
jgi:dephospho-CoA kinase